MLFHAGCVGPSMQCGKDCDGYLNKEVVFIRSWKKDTDIVELFISASNRPTTYYFVDAKQAIEIGRELIESGREAMKGKLGGT